MRNAYNFVQLLGCIVYPNYVLLCIFFKFILPTLCKIHKTLSESGQPGIIADYPAMSIQKCQQCQTRHAMLLIAQFTCQNAILGLGISLEVDKVDESCDL